jgi:hypothetical protein
MSVKYLRVAWSNDGDLECLLCDKIFPRKNISEEWNWLSTLKHVRKDHIEAVALSRWIGISMEFGVVGPKKYQVITYGAE